MSHPTFDHIDAAILAERKAKRDAIEGPRVGDWVHIGERIERFTFDWDDDGLQTTSQGLGLGSFYLDSNGHGDYSGALDPCIKREHLKLVGVRVAPFWFFHHNHHRAHNGVTVELLCRVYELVRP